MSEPASPASMPGRDAPEPSSSLPVRACHEHGTYHGNDSWDAECCICCDNPCGSVDVERMRLHRRWDQEQTDRYVAYVIENKGVLPDAPF